jgi:CBS domain-containing protein
MKVKDYMRKNIATVDLCVTICEASKAMADYNIGYLMVLEKANPVGIVTERDVVHRAIAKGLDSTKGTVEAIMSSPIIPIDPNASIEEAVDIMVKKKLRRLPVVKDSLIYGIFTARDLIDHFGELEDRLTKDLVSGFYFMPSKG